MYHSNQVVTFLHCTVLNQSVMSGGEEKTRKSALLLTEVDGT